MNKMTAVKKSILSCFASGISRDSECRFYLLPHAYPCFTLRFIMRLALRRCVRACCTLAVKPVHRHADCC